VPPPAPRRRRIRDPRHPAAGLAALLLVALLTGFFAWTTAEPFWLAAGHSASGTATVGRCEGKGVLHRCLASFTSRSFTAKDVTLVGADRTEGARVPARMVSGSGRIAYAGTADGLRVRWSVGLTLILVCGAAVAWVTGARRLPSGRGRTGAVVLSFAAPLLLFAGMLAATF
jgi:hypothetical protein